MDTSIVIFIILFIILIVWSKVMQQSMLDTVVEIRDMIKELGVTGVEKIPVK